MSTYTGVISSRILLSQLEVLECQSVQIDNLAAKKCRVFKEGLCTHDSVNMCLGETAINVLHEVDSSVGDHWNG